MKWNEWKRSPPTCVSPTNDPVGSQDGGFPNTSCRYTNLHRAQSENYSSYPQHWTLWKSLKRFSKFHYRQRGGRGEASRRLFFVGFRGESPDNKTLYLRYQGCFLDSICVTSIYINRTDFMRVVNSCSLYRTARKRSESIKIAFT